LHIIILPMALVKKNSGTGKFRYKNLITVFWTIPFLLTGCSFPHYYYTPNIQSVPLFEEKNEFSGLVAGSFGTNACLELQGGFAFPGHVALLTNFMTGGIDRSSSTYTDYMKINYFEGALGYYNSYENNLVFEIYGGYGGGSQNHAFSHTVYDNWLIPTVTSDGMADINYSKIFIQPDFGFRIKNFSAAFSCRVSRLYYTDLTFDSQYRIEELHLFEQNKDQWFLEPAFTMRGGVESVKFMIQFGFAANVTNPDMKYEKFRFCLGAGFNIGPKTEKK
jgi:hypothetical protein